MIKELLKNNIIMSIGSIIALIVNIISMPIITRVYVPSDIGTFAALHVFSLFLFPIFSMRLEIIFGQKINTSKLKNLLLTSILIGISFSIISFILLFVLAKYLEKYLLINFLSFIIVLPVFLTLFQYGIGILNHLKLYKSIAIISTLGIFFQKFFQIIFGITMQNKTMAIFLSYCIPTFLFSLITFFIIHKKINIFKNIKFSFNAIKEYSDHIFYRVSYSLSNFFKDRFIIILIITFFSAEQAGLYSQALSLLLIPTAIFSIPIKTIITREYQENSKNTINMIVIIYNMLVNILLPVYVYLFFNSSHLFPVIFGQDWAQMSNIFNILLAPMFILIFSTSFDRLYDVLGAQKYAFLFEFFFGIFCFGSFFLMAYLNFEFIEALKVNSVILVLFFTTFIIFILNRAKEIISFMTTAKYFFFQTLFCSTLFLLIKDNLFYSTLLLFAIVLIGLLMTKNDLKKELIF